MGFSIKFYIYFTTRIIRRYRTYMSIILSDYGVKYGIIHNLQPGLV